ncbi:MAG: ABC transporter permease [Verrucomicrobiales bacterium]
MNEKKKKTRFFSPARVLVIARSTFTQLVRMKIFYFLAPIALAFIALQFFDLPYYEGPEANSAVAELRYHKTICLGTMMLFGCLFGIVSTALLIPRDIEDRTLYTILCKPVPRLDYLVGKLLGVIAVIFISMLVMDVLLMATLYFRTQSVMTEIRPILAQNGYSEEDIARFMAGVREQGVSWTLQAGVFAHFLKATVLAGVALLISTFSSSTLFTIATSTMVWIIGAAQAGARSVWEESSSMVTKVLSSVLALAFPNFKLFEAIADGAARVENIVLDDVGKIAGLSFFYVGIYVVLSWFVFSDKEF